MTYRAALRKKNIELVLMWPFVMAGKFAGMFFKLKTKHSIFLFFPSADIGGSIKVNADILECIKDQKPLIIFSKRPKNNQFLHLFQKEGVRIIDLHHYIDNKLFHFVNFFFRGVISVWINKVEKPVVFGGEGLFFYKVLPHLKKQARTIELCHLNTWIDFTQAFVSDIDLRIFSTPKIKRDVEKQYQVNGVPTKYLDRLIFFDNKVDIPVFTPVSNDILEVLFVGRGSPQKRVHLIAAIAKRVHEINAPVHFTFVGDVDQVIPPDVRPYCTLLGNIQDEKRLHTIYSNSDVLILTSAYEGLPIVVMDMMARGKVIVSTAVDGIPDYITDNNNGFLIFEKDEQMIVEKGIELLLLIARDDNLRKKIGLAAYQYALDNFAGEKFDDFYRKIFLEELVL